MFRAPVGTMVLALLAGGCAPPHDPDTLRILVEKAPTSLDPRVGSDQASSRAHALMHRGLFRLDRDGSPVGDLVLRVTMENDRTYTLALRPGATFSDGRPLTSRDVRFTLASILDGSSFRKPDLDKVIAVDAPDEATVVIRLREPSASLLVNLTFGIVPEGSAIGSEAPLGLGPYRVEARRGPHVMDFARWGEVPPGAFRRVRLLALPDEMARGLAIRKGDVDLLVNDLSPEVFKSLSRDRRYRAITVPGSNYAYLMMNCEAGPLRDVRIRQSIAFAIDEGRMLDALLLGLGRPATGLLSPESWAYHRPPEPHATYPTDPARAMALLDAAGYADADGPGGRPRFTLSYKTSTLSSRAQAAVIQHDLDRVGIGIDIRQLEWATFYEDIKKGSFELASLVWIGIADPDALRSRFHSAMFPPAGVNRVRYRNPALDELLDRGERTLDREERRPIYAQAQEILARDVPYASLWYKSNYALVRREIEGVDLGPFADFHFVSELRRKAP